VRFARNPDAFGNNESRSRNDDGFWRKRRTACCRKCAGRALACVFCRHAVWQFALRGAFAVADFEEGPVLVGSLSRDLRARERTDDELQDEPGMNLAGSPARAPCD
jgi:hypothetical protein